MIQYLDIITVLILSDKGLISWFDNNIIVYDQISILSICLFIFSPNPAIILSLISQEETVIFLP